jgi:hypothetical protein
MPSQLKPLHGESFTQFLRDSAASSRSWPQWVSGEDRSIISPLCDGGQDHNTEKVAESSRHANDPDSE